MDKITTNDTRRNNKPVNSFSNSFIFNDNSWESLTEELHDVNEDGKETPWQSKKQLNTKTADIYDTLSRFSVSDLDRHPRIAKVYRFPDTYKNKADRLKECASCLIFATTQKRRLKLNSANFCRVRMCPMCNWRRSLKLRAQLCQVLGTKKAQEHAYIFLTLTIPNVPDSELSDTLTALSKGFSKLQHHKKFKQAVKGYFKACEITYNKERRDWHPHYHVLIAVNPSYFKKSDYIKQAEWLEMWRRAMNDDSITQVDVRRVKAQGDGVDVFDAINEVAKYSVKDTDYIDIGDDMFTMEQIAILDNYLDKRRLASFGGILRDIKSRLGLDDVEGDNADLINVTNDDEDDPIDETIPLKRYQWLEGVNGYRAID